MLRHTAILFVLLALVGCGGSGGSSMPASAAHNVAAGPLTSSALSATISTTGWGVGYAAEPVISDGATANWMPVFCQTKGYGYQTCPQTQTAKRVATYSVHRSLTDSTKSTATVTIGDSSGLGVYSFNEVVAQNVVAPAFESRNNSKFAWTDTVTPTSLVLKQGTSVELSVVLTLQPGSVTPPCASYYATGFQFTATFSGANSGNPVQLTGACVTQPVGSQAFEVTNSEGQPSNTDVGVINAAIGQPFTISSSGYTYIGIACHLNCAPGQYGQTLAGDIHYTLTPQQGGVTLTTASGQIY